MLKQRAQRCCFDQLPPVSLRSPAWNGQSGNFALPVYEMASSLERFNKTVAAAFLT
jgi:hypothetical protein